MGCYPDFDFDSVLLKLLWHRDSLSSWECSIGVMDSPYVKVFGSQGIVLPISLEVSSATALGIFTLLWLRRKYFSLYSEESPLLIQFFFGHFSQIHPENARFLNERERKLSVHRTLKDMSNLSSLGSFKRSTSLTIGLLYIPCQYMQWWNKYSEFNSLLIDGFGFGSLQTLLLQIPVGGSQLALLAIMRY
ncbi:MFS transporter [Penicillium odoratum]|uniref:MFS transporter n=1 Tax=Penicillium odoratum TaxID=1167516 RepID=UPI0025481D6A|nr:MFS transporter [Penicillium odoratum]KAJ5771659.1 MFS transporter [Penicillium odoratum]